MPQKLDLTNKEFGLVRCLHPVSSRNGKTYWLCECVKCGAQKEIQTSHLTSGAITSCKCGCVESTHKKICPICKTEFTLISSTDNARKYCYICSPQGRENNYAPLSRAMKQQIIKERGGKCERCGYDKSIYALCFHHRNPQTKLFELSMNSGSASWEKYQAEAKKCDLLCLNCHAEIHQGQFN